MDSRLWAWICAALNFHHKNTDVALGTSGCFLELDLVPLFLPPSFMFCLLSGFN